MTTSTLAILIFASTVAYFAVSRLSRRPGPKASSYQYISKVLAVFILGLTAFYFYMRFVG